MAEGLKIVGYQGSSRVDIGLIPIYEEVAGSDGTNVERQPDGGGIIESGADEHSPAKPGQTITTQEVGFGC